MSFESHFQRNTWNFEQYFPDGEMRLDNSMIWIIFYLSGAKNSTLVV